MNMGYINFGDWEGALLGVNVHWLRLKVLGISHLHEKAFKVLAEQVFIRRRKLNL